MSSAAERRPRRGPKKGVLSTTQSAPVEIPSSEWPSRVGRALLYFFAALGVAICAAWVSDLLPFALRFFCPGRPDLTTSATMPDPSPSALPAPVQARAEELLKLWSSKYGLGLPTPPREVLFGRREVGASKGWAPHLQECSELDRLRRREEQLGTPAPELPPWACASPAAAGNTSTSFCPQPKPPWVLGSDADNLPLTRVAQRDLWVRQFPPGDCSQPGLRFLLAEWSINTRGVGAQLTLMTSALSLAYHSRRILVPVGGYPRANHSQCKRAGKMLDWECYFSPFVSAHCQREALRLKDQLRPQKSHNRSEAFSEARLVWQSVTANLQVGESSAALQWGQPWSREATFELLGVVQQNLSDSQAQLNWWRSQALRFMMRWPAPLLCHLVNLARHAAYGRHVAERVALAEAQQVALEGGGRLQGEEQRALHSRDTAGEPVELTGAWHLAQEPYVPRPIVSVHVRQGDKAREMKLFSFEAYMWQAYRVRRLVPDAKFVWLSTEMQTVIDKSKEYKDWDFFWTDIPRQNSSEVMAEHELSVGLDVSVGDSFVNLMIASQCDMFVGVLGSNWNRLINRMRLTNGRAKATYIALNYGDY